MENLSSAITLPPKTLANILELIKIMTGLKNFNEIYLKYVQILNNLQDDYYEHPKQLDVEQCVKGLLEKYYIQGFPLEAKEFEMRVNQFINNSNINNHSNLSSNTVKWSIISMIINMANNPCGSRNAYRKTNLQSIRIELEGETAVLGDSWKTNLIQELLDIGRSSNYVESDTETDLDDETDSCLLSSTSLQTITMKNMKDKTNCLTNKEYLKLLFTYEDRAKKLLIKRASQFWWLNKYENIVNGGKNCSHFALRRFSNNNIFKIVEDNYVILECLNNHLTPFSFLQYNLEDQIKLFGFIIILSYISPEVFNHWISTISQFIEKFNILMTFIHHIKGLKKVPYTLRAYATGLEHILEPIIKKMGTIENRIKNQVGHETILSFEEEMYLHFQIVSFVFSVHSKALISNWESADNWKTSIKLIAVLFWSIQTAIVDYQKSVVMILFLHTFETYVHMTELWIHAGELVDENNEFIISNYEGDSSTVFSIFFKDIHEYLDNCNLNVPPILEYLIHFLNNCDWKVFVALKISNDDINTYEVPRGELFHNFLIEIKNSNNNWKNYITPFNEYNPSNWNQLPLLASSCVSYRYTDKSTFHLTSPSSFEMVDIFFFVVQRAINNIGLKVRDIFLKENKFIHHLKNLYSLIFLEEINKSVSIDRMMEYKIEQNSFLNNYFYSLLGDDHSSILSFNHPCNLSLNYKTEKNIYSSENNIIKDNFADELERISISYTVKFPLSLILTNDVIFKYNKIFRLLMTSKQATEKISQLQTKVLEEHVSQAIKLCMLDGLMEKLSYGSFTLLWNACDQFYQLWMKSVTNENIDVELMEIIEQEYVDSCWKLASNLDTYLVAENDSSSILYEFCRDFMSSMPTKESADLDGSLIYKLSDSRNRYSFTYM
ncbi:uncharacterized protein LOC112681083 isoform X2 [Sipha flava]|uniref:Gamma-tubulin complex component n=1 Tax=Sipha flava TaxID=143950 RepID=A0A8B8F8G7_9HEMI|nr:uncharacterized protein LOC112681083 isoform X2 [Sipha flava]